MKKKESKTASKNYETVLIEHMDSQFKAFGEGLSLLSEQFETFEKGQGVLTKKVENLEVGQKVLFDKVGKIEKRLDKVEVKLDSVSRDVVEIKHNIARKVDLEDFQKLEKRVIGLEKMMLSLTT